MLSYAALTRILDWLDDLSGGDRRSIRFLLLLLAVPVLLIAGERVVMEAFFDEPNSLPIATLTPEEQQRIVDEIVDETLDEAK